jgi:hypothetical protein
MIESKSRFRLTISASLLAGSVALAGCATPETRTTSTEQTTTTTPPPAMSTVSTTTTTDDNENTASVAPAHRSHPRYAMHRHRTNSGTDDVIHEETSTTDTTVTPVAAPTTTTTRSSTESHTNVR